MKPDDVVVGVLEGAVETKVRPAVVISSATYLAERPDVLMGIPTTRPPKPLAGGWPPRGIPFSCICADGSPLRADDHWPPQRSRLEQREALRG